LILQKANTEGFYLWFWHFNFLMFLSLITYGK
jgi:hypothetical protein